MDSDELRRLLRRLGVEADPAESPQEPVDEVPRLPDTPEAPWAPQGATEPPLGTIKFGSDAYAIRWWTNSEQPDSLARSWVILDQFGIAGGLADDIVKDWPIVGAIPGTPASRGET